MKGMARHTEVLSRRPEVLQALLVEATPHELAWKPAPDRWSISEVLGHLVDVERVMRQQAAQIVENEHPLLELYDQQAAYARGAYSGKSAQQQLSRFCRLRRGSVAWLRNLPRAASGRTGEHPQLGSLCLDQILHLWAFHDLGHLRQITEVLRTVCHWDGIGPLKRLYRVRP